METFQIVACPTTELSHTNKAILNPSENFAQFPHIAVRYPKKTEAFVFSVITDRAIEKGKIAFNMSGRKWADLMLDSVIEAAPYKFEPQSQCLNSISFYVDFYTYKNALTNDDFDTDEMARQFSLKFHNQAFTVGQLFGFPFLHKNRPVVLALRVKEMQAIPMEGCQPSVEIGLTTANTVAMFERAEGSEIRLTGRLTNATKPKIFGQDWNFASMGIGGLSEQFNIMFRRAFASRLLPPHFNQAIGTEFVRGILLYGPPGTGKTLIARQIGKMLLAREPKVVNGPELLNKYVGESEANVRKLFAEAEEEQAKAGINSGLHVIIFDEIDALCKQRGTTGSSSGAGDNVVNQLLSKIDGVDSLQNILLIGMTNRKDLIDEALLRPGRFEVQIEIGLPNKQGRFEIFEIHTAKLHKQGILDASVDLDELAEVAKNYSGAEIAGLIKAALSIAIARVTKADSDGIMKEITQEMLDQIKVTREDFEHAMKNDIKPALGASEDQLNSLIGRVVRWDPIIDQIQHDLVENIQASKEDNNDRPYYVLLQGEPGSGTTTLAAHMASKTGFPFIRIYQADATADKTESAKVQYIKKLFDDASKSELSCVVIDDLEIILDYGHIGPTYSKTTRNKFVTISKTTLPKGHRMLVICTCQDRQFLEDLRLNKVFDNIIRVPLLTRADQVERVLQESGTDIFTAEQCREIAGGLRSVALRLAIKRVEKLIKVAVVDEPGQRVEKFLKRLSNQLV